MQLEPVGDPKRVQGSRFLGNTKAMIRRSRVRKDTSLDNSMLMQPGLGETDPFHCAAIDIEQREHRLLNTLFLPSSESLLPLKL